MKKTILIMPAYNEEKTIGSVLDKVKKIKDKGIIDKILVVDDGSTDRTAKIAKEKGMDVVSHVVNRGIGAAQQTGYEISINEGYDYLIQMDADSQHNPKYITKIINELENGNAMVIASRKHKFNMPFVRRIGIIFFSFLASSFNDKKIKDITSGFRGYRVEALKGLEELPDNHWAIEQTLTFLNKKLKIKETPINMEFRKIGRSQFDNLETLISYPFKMFDVFIRKTIRRIFR